MPRDRASIITKGVARVDEIAKRLEQLEQRFTTAERERDEYRALYLETMERCRKLELGIMSSNDCAAACINQFMRGDALLVPGMVNKLALFAGRLVPRSMLVSQAGKMYRDALATRPK